MSLLIKIVNKPTFIVAGLTLSVCVLSLLAFAPSPACPDLIPILAALCIPLLALSDQSSGGNDDTGEDAEDDTSPTIVSIPTWAIEEELKKTKETASEQEDIGTARTLVFSPQQLEEARKSQMEKESGRSSGGTLAYVPVTTKEQKSQVHQPHDTQEHTPIQMAQVTQHEEEEYQAGKTIAYMPASGDQGSKTVAYSPEQISELKQAAGLLEQSKREGKQPLSESTLMSPKSSQTEVPETKPDVTKATPSTQKEQKGKDDLPSTFKFDTQQKKGSGPALLAIAVLLLLAGAALVYLLWYFDVIVIPYELDLPF